VRESFSSLRKTPKPSLSKVCEAQHDRRADHLVSEINMRQWADFGLRLFTISVFGRLPDSAGHLPHLRLWRRNHPQWRRRPIPRLDALLDFADKVREAQGAPQVRTKSDFFNQKRNTEASQ
jgi:hypothetical protein